MENGNLNQEYRMSHEAEICHKCHEAIWFDESTDTYETATGEFMCDGFNGHEPTI